MTSQPGTYVLILACRRTGAVRIGGLGTMQLQADFRAYTRRRHGKQRPRLFRFRFDDE